MANEEKWEYDPLTHEPTNHQRTLWAQAAIDGFRNATGDCEDEADLRDLLADLMHWAKAHNVDFEDELGVARRNFESEVTGDGD